MKTVGKQLQEARLAKDWTPELAARETKIKVDRLRDLESDDYSHFTSPTYARGFVRTYARALGLDEYRILRQLDQKLPDDDSANIVTDTGVAYLPETAMPARAAHRDYTGLYIVMGLGFVVTLAIVFVLFEAYRVGELSRVFGSGSETVAAAPATNAAPEVATSDAPLRAKPIDSDTPPPIVEATNAAPNTNAVAEATPSAADGNAAMAVAPRALPVDPSVVGTTTSAMPSQDTPIQAPRALPVDPSTTSTEPAVTATPAPVTATQDTIPVAPRALPVDPADMTNADSATTTVALNNPPAQLPPVDETNTTTPVAPPAIIPSVSARQSNNGPVVMPTADPAPAVPPATPDSTTNSTSQAAAPSDSDSGKRLVLTASEDSFVRVTNLDSPSQEVPLYASVLHSGQSVGFDGRKFSINVGIPSAVDIKLDGVNYGPHSDQNEPETFTVESHLP